jgi:hypothetical protein
VTGLGTPNYKTIASLVINNESFFPALGAFPAGRGAADDSNQLHVPPPGQSMPAHTIASLVLSCIAIFLSSLTLLMMHKNQIKAAFAGRPTAPLSAASMHQASYDRL